MFRHLVLLLATALVAAACSGEEPVVTTDLASPEQVVAEWFAALAEGDLPELDAVTDPANVALAAGAENAFSVDQMKAVVETGLPAATRRSYWNSFGDSFVEFLGAELDEIVVSGTEEFSVDDVDFAAVFVMRQGQDSEIIVRRTDTGWVVDMVATVGPALAVQIRRLVDSIVRHGDDAAAFAYATIAVQSLGAGLARQPANRALELELEAIEDLPIDLSR
ncbi:MAG TPA: hypothetical protein VLG28_08500 [Acidimicrobiia bacterium]|jgi:hypothetical protein|nr:hypothetical protein [Acidimicrobiia bacterium]